MISLRSYALRVPRFIKKYNDMIRMKLGQNIFLFDKQNILLRRAKDGITS